MHLEEDELLKKFFCALLAALVLLSANVVSAEQEDVSAYLLMDFETGQILEAHNINEALPPASITKLMTMHLIFEALDTGQISLTDQVKASANASNLSADASQIFLGTGEVLTVKELLVAVATFSANDASIALAEHIAGSESAFVQKMNDKAEELGLTGTTFINSHGLHTPGHTMSARDIALLSRDTLAKYPEILEYTATKFVRMERATRYVRQGYFDMPSTFANLIGWRNIDGLKTGWTPEAGSCITVTAEEGDRRYIAVIMGAQSTGVRNQMVKELLTQGLDHYLPKTAITTSDVIDTLEIKNAKAKESSVIPAQDVTLVMKRDMNVESFDQEVQYKIGLEAPLQQGDVVGTLTYSRDGRAITTVDLVVQQDVERANFFTRTLRFLSQAFTDLGNWIMGLFS